MSLGDYTVLPPVPSINRPQCHPRWRKRKTRNIKTLVKFLFIAWSPSRHFGRLPGIPKQLHALLFLVSVKYLLWCKNHGHSLEPIFKMGMIYVSSENEI